MYIIIKQVGPLASILLFSIIILAASILQTSTGFGFSIIATPLLLLIFEPREAIQINLIISLVISFALINNIKKDVDVGIVRRFAWGGVLGLPLGLAVFLYMEVNVLKLIISIIILLLTALLLLRFKMNQTEQRDYIAGGFSGAFTTSIGMPGPPILLYFSGTHTKKEKLRATTLAFYLFIYFVSLAIQVVAAGTSKLIWLSSISALPLVAIGLLLGQLLFKRINQALFQKLTYVLLLFTGIYLLIEQL
ncbi:sulfite exporter TauE/SafE family protein [Virgibacillus salexigens]|uniref:sulfite exporter TauE/SafE family protein n=1 Tax=Virgibacillus salexigens TaxID=61016 RepID=UPI003081D1C2